MALSTFVKINSVNNLTDARYCAGMYVDLLGFEISPNAEKTIDTQTFKEITGWLSGVEYAAELENESEEEVLRLLTDYDLQWVEHKNIDVLVSLREKGFNCIYKQDLTHVKSVKLELAEELKSKGIYLHLTSKNKELSDRELELVKQLAGSCDVLLGSGISPQNLQKSLENIPLKGLALNAGNEIKPGLKDFDELADILEILEIED